MVKERSENYFLMKIDEENKFSEKQDPEVYLEPY